MKPARKTIHEAFLLTLNLHWKGTRNEEKACANFMALELILGADFPVDKVDSAIISKLIDRMRTDGLAGATVNRKLCALTKVLQTAHRAGMRKDPAPSGLGLRESPHRTRVLTTDEVTTMHAFLGEPVSKALVIFLVETGMRVGEALALIWGRVSAGRAVINRNKSDLPRSVPLTREAEAALRTLGGGHATSPVFPISQRAFNDDWAQARFKMGLSADKEFVPHALRHTCATRLVEAGTPLPVVQKWLGHKTIAMTMRYAHVKDEQLTLAAKNLEARS